MARTALPDAVEWYSDGREWADFSDLREKPRAIMLDRDGRFPDVPYEPADELFARVIAKLATGELVGFGRWGFRSEFAEIEIEHWLTSYCNIWFNKLGYAECGKMGYSGICVEPRSAVVAELGFSPAARTSLVIKEEEGPDPADKFFA